MHDMAVISHNRIRIKMWFPGPVYCCTIMVPNIPSHCRGTCGSNPAQIYCFFYLFISLISCLYVILYTGPAIRRHVLHDSEEHSHLLGWIRELHLHKQVIHSTDNALYIKQRALYLVSVICVEFSSNFLTGLLLVYSSFLARSLVYSSLNFKSTYLACAHPRVQGWWAVGQWFSAPISGQQEWSLMLHSELNPFITSDQPYCLVTVRVGIYAYGECWWTQKPPWAHLCCFALWGSAHHHLHKHCW